MTISSTTDGSSSTPRPAVTNPYLKKKVQITAPAPSKPHANNAGPLNAAPKAPVSSSVGHKNTVPNGTGAMRKFANNAVTPNKMQAQRAHNVKPYQHVSAVKTKPTSSRIKPNVTPTPKKTVKQVPHVSQPPIASTLAKQIPTANLAQTKSAPIKSKSSSLKSQLKSQIASLKHAKKQRLLQIEHEKQMALKEVQLKQKQEEMMLLLEQKEEERRSIEKVRQLQERERREKLIRKEVGICLSQVVKRVEVRVGWEQKRGVPYPVGECLQFLVTEVEKRNAKPQTVSFCGQHIAATMMPFSVYRGQMLNGQVIRPMHSLSMMPYQAVSASAPVKPKVAQPKPLILHPSPLEKYSPFGDSYKILEETVCMTKKDGESFGVSLRFDCRSVLVPRDDEEKCVVAKSQGCEANFTEDLTTPDSVPSKDAVGTALTPSPAPAALKPLETNSAPNISLSVSNQKPKKRRRRRVNYGVMTVTDASKAKFMLAPDGKQSQGLKHGDLIIEINGRNVGGLTFSEACKAIATTSVENKETGSISCSLKIARMVQTKAVVATPHPFSTVPANLNPALRNNANALDSSRAVLLPSTAISIPHAPLIPFIVLGDKVSGEFTAAEWQMVVRSLTLIRRGLSTGSALQPVPEKDVLLECLKRNEFRKVLQQRSLETIEMKLAYEGRKIMSEMKHLAEKNWALAWKSEVDGDADNENNTLFQEPLTDAKRSVLRFLARPITGCRCGSATHEFVSDPKCVLYRDVKSFADANDTTNPDTAEINKKVTNKSKARNAMEAAYIDRFVKLRAETEAAKREAEFILNMEMKQSKDLKKAVFAPKLLCTIVLSAIASLMDETPIDEQMVDSSAADENTIGNGEVRTQVAGAHSSDDDSDDDDVPLTALAHVGTKREHASAASASPKRLKLNSEGGIKKVPSPYTLAKILKYISKTYGHLYQEPAHLDYGWQVHRVPFIIFN